MNNIRCFISSSLIGLTILSAAALNAAMFANSATAETITGRSRNVRAEIAYEKSQDYQYKNVILKIMRAGKTILNQKLPQASESDRPLASMTEELKLPVVDLDGNKEPK